jgi:predicted DNA-binding protein (MmcQ/YjbR family)
VRLKRHAVSIVWRGVARTREKLLAFALGMPGAHEDHPWGEDVAKVQGKVFVFLGVSGSTRITVKLDESHGHALSVDGAEPTGYGLGKSGWVTVPLRAPGVSLDLLRDWIEESYRIVAPRRLVAQLDGGPDPPT